MVWPLSGWVSKTVNELEPPLEVPPLLAFKNKKKNGYDFIIVAYLIDYFITPFRNYFNLYMFIFFLYILFQIWWQKYAGFVYLILFNQYLHLQVLYLWLFCCSCSCFCYCCWFCVANWIEIATRGDRGTCVPSYKSTQSHLNFGGEAGPLANVCSRFHLVAQIPNYAYAMWADSWTFLTKHKGGGTYLD